MRLELTKMSVAGDFHSFVFSLLPDFRLHRPSGVNSNFQWTGVGFSQLPNGIGFGGQARFDLKCSWIQAQRIHGLKTVIRSSIELRSACEQQARTV